MYTSKYPVSITSRKGGVSQDGIQPPMAESKMQKHEVEEEYCKLNTWVKRSCLEDLTAGVTCCKIDWLTGTKCFGGMNYNRKRCYAQGTTGTYDCCVKEIVQTKYPRSWCERPFLGKLRELEDG